MRHAHKRIYPGSRGTTETPPTLTRVYVQKEQSILYGLYPNTWKGMFLSQQQKPKIMALLIL